jgi:hypothetical protein
MHADASVATELEREHEHEVEPIDEPATAEFATEDTFEYVVEAELVIDELAREEAASVYSSPRSTATPVSDDGAIDGWGERSFDANPIDDEDMDGLVAVGSAALSDAVDEVGEIADALAQKLIQFRGSDGAKEASAHMAAAAGGVAELIAIAKRVGGGARRESEATETRIAVSSAEPKRTDATSTIGNAASTVLFSSLRAVGVVVRDVVLSPEVSEHTLKAARGSVKAAGAFGRAALQRLDGSVSERERVAARARARLAEDDVLIMEPQWVERKRGAFGCWEIVDSSRKRRRQQMNYERAKEEAGNQTR